MKDKDRLEIILEELRDNFKLVGERFDSADDAIEDVRSKLERLENKVDDMQLTLNFVAAESKNSKKRIAKLESGHAR